MLQVTFFSVAFIFLAWMNTFFEVHGEVRRVVVGHNIFGDDPTPTSPRRARELEEQDRADSRRKKIEKALNYSKYGRSYTPRREHLSGETKRRYDVHRHTEFRSAASVELANLALTQKLKENAKPEEIRAHQLLKHQAAQVHVTGRALQDYHNKAANNLLPEHLRDEHVRNQHSRHQR
ncbi:uncharacterized protein FA14DRAFT_179830 [Meira miltonrushii]|uniref:Uncharacterized protein n=1 Tax=Meira miltonrushii TaxID=1280837 RepID=A0A316V6N0_9BASI|nr:uncharacterized protein FA14DRAFT_179830 [Meira miltonrushii]PWN33176.1 hypothetical protein FA14DRAFT_179830 [Meira miltonrushii]